jgi:hypothetical protein
VRIAALLLASAAAVGAALPQAATVAGTQPLSPRATVLIAARGERLCELRLPAAAGGAADVSCRGGGRPAQARLSFPSAVYLRDLSFGADGLYAGTAVIRRFSAVRDELVRIDPQTLAVGARASFPAAVSAADQSGTLLATIADGRVLRLDPRTLAIRASRRLLPAAAVRTQGLTLSPPAAGLGSGWVLAGDARDLELVRLDPMSLAVRSRTRVPTGGLLAQALWRVVADARHVELVGSAVVAVDAAGRLVRRPVPVPGLATAELHGDGLVGLEGGPPAVVLLDDAGRVRARTPLLDAGGELVASGQDAWFEGDAGHGVGIVHLRLHR